METNGLFSTKFFYFKPLGYFYILTLKEQRWYIVMTYETFSEIITTIKENDQRQQQLYELKVDLLDYTDPWDKLISILLTEIYGKEGYDLFSWFCYENDFGKTGVVGAWDQEGNPICYNIKSTWEYLETNYNKQK